jgi:DNA-binding transcriptional ArsR family regulator
MDDIQVVAEPHRRHILRLIWDRERSAGDIASEFAITFGAVSQHLAVLRESGFVTVRPEGNLRMYRADKEALGPLRPMLEAMWAQKLDDLARTVEEGQS